MSNSCCQTHFNRQRSGNYRVWLDVHTRVPYLLALNPKPKPGFPRVTSGHPPERRKRAALASLVHPRPGLVPLEVELRHEHLSLGGRTTDTKFTSRRPLSSHQMVITFHPHQPGLDSSQWVVGGGGLDHVSIHLSHQVSFLLVFNYRDTVALAQGKQIAADPKGNVWKPISEIDSRGFSEDNETGTEILVFWPKVIKYN